MQKTLIICEKPSASLHLAEALGKSNNIRKRIKNEMPYYEVQTDNKEITICSAIGHFYGVDSKDKIGRSYYPIWDYTWRPLYEIERNHNKQKNWIDTIGNLAKECDSFINACDYDIEGSLIGYMVLKYACNGVDKIAKRMKFSTLTEKDLKKAYNNPDPKLDFPMINAGMCRHEVDWIYGINLSRALTESAKRYSNRYFTLSTGRVQGPTLKFLVEREKEIITFVPVPYWTIEACVDVNGNLINVDYEKEKIASIEEGENVVRITEDKYGIIDDLETKRYNLSPPTPFDISALQSEAYRHFGFTPRQTLGLAERLYLKALISYPRTSSQKLPESIDFKEILNKIGILNEYEEIVRKILLKEKLKPNEGKKTDSAHPAIYPTGVLPDKLEVREKKIFDLIVKRFFATFGDVAIKESNKAIIKVENKRFYMKASKIIEKGWIEFYDPYVKFDESLLPSINIGDRVKFVRIEAEKKHSKPPPRYNPSSLLKLMEKENIGTKATRADIIDILYRRGYVKEERMMVTPLAFKIDEILTKYCPKVMNTSFTRELEDMMVNIELNKESKEKAVIEAIDNLKPVIYDLKKQEKELGKELSKTIKKMKQSEITFDIHCPICGSRLLVVRSRKSGKRFIGCSGMWENKCRFSLPLPQFGTLKLLDKYCTKCGFQIIQVKSKGKKPLVSCPQCFVEKKKIKSNFNNKVKSK